MMPGGSSDLDTPVEVYSRTEAVDTAGAPAPVWTTLAFRAMAMEETGQGGEQDTADQDASFSRVVFWIRYRPDVVSTMRVRRNGQDHDVKSADPVGRRQWLRIICERVNDG